MSAITDNKCYIDLIISPYGREESFNDREKPSEDGLWYSTRYKLPDSQFFNTHLDQDYTQSPPVIILGILTKEYTTK